MCGTANQQSISSHMVVYMACKMRCRWLTFRRCFVNRALSRNRSLRDAKPARHLFVWFAKHCLAEHCLSFRGDTDECEKQFCFVFRICLAFFDSRLWRPLGAVHNYQHFHKLTKGSLFQTPLPPSPKSTTTKCGFYNQKKLFSENIHEGVLILSGNL